MAEYTVIWQSGPGADVVRIEKSTQVLRGAIYRITAGPSGKVIEPEVWSWRDALDLCEGLRDWRVYAGPLPPRSEPSTE